MRLDPLKIENLRRGLRQISGEMYMGVIDVLLAPWPYEPEVVKSALNAVSPLINDMVYNAKEEWQNEDVRSLQWLEQQGRAVLLLETPPCACNDDT